MYSCFKYNSVLLHAHDMEMFKFTTNDSDNFHLLCDLNIEKLIVKKIMYVKCFQTLSCILTKKNIKKMKYKINRIVFQNKLETINLDVLFRYKFFVNMHV